MYTDTVELLNNQQIWVDVFNQTGDRRYADAITAVGDFDAFEPIHKTNAPFEIQQLLSVTPVLWNGKQWVWRTTRFEPEMLAERGANDVENMLTRASESVKVSKITNLSTLATGVAMDMEEIQAPFVGVSYHGIRESDNTHIIGTSHFVHKRITRDVNTRKFAIGSAFGRRVLRPLLSTSRERETIKKAKPVSSREGAINSMIGVMIARSVPHKRGSISVKANVHAPVIVAGPPSDK